MKKTIVLAAIFAGVLAVAAPAAPARADVAVSFSFFHQSLAPYGRWVSVGSYGQCWAPVGVDAGWQPYTVGHWVYTDYGWTWVPSDPWGEVTYRYGTWTFAQGYGWIWVPGFVWAPAWVTWSYSDDYIGWAPIPPTFSLAASGYVGAPVIVSRTAYVFVPTTRFVNVDVARVRVPVTQNTVLLAHGQNVTRFPVSGGIVRNQGPEPAQIERVAKVSIPRASPRGLQPVRVDAARMNKSGNRIPVVAPASAKRTEAGGHTVSATERTSSSGKNTRSETASRPPASSHESDRNVKHEAPAKPPSHEKSSAERPPASAERHPASPPPAHGSDAAAQKQKQKQDKSSAAAREKSRPEAGAAQAPHSAPAPENARANEQPVQKEASHRPAEPHGSPQNAKHAQPKPPPAKPQPEKQDKSDKPS